jgi:hypothetical protein
MNSVKVRSSAIVALLLAVTTSIAIPQAATSPSAGSTASGPDAYVGAWRMSFHGKQVGVVEFIKYKDQLTGTFSNMRADIGADDVISMRPLPGSAPVVETAISGASLHFVVAEPNDATLSFQMTLKPSDKAYLLFDRKAPNGQTMDFELSRLTGDQNETDPSQ